MRTSSTPPCCTLATGLVSSWGPGPAPPNCHTNTRYRELGFLSIDSRYISTLSTPPTGSVSSLTRCVGKSVTAIYYPRTTQLGAGSARLGRARTRNVAIITQTAPAPAPAPAAASTVAKSELRVRSNVVLTSTTSHIRHRVLNGPSRSSELYNHRG